MSESDSGIKTCTLFFEGCNFVSSSYTVLKCIEGLRKGIEKNPAQEPEFTVAEVCDLEELMTKFLISLTRKVVFLNHELRDEIKKEEFN